MADQPYCSRTQALWWLHDGRWYQEVARRFGHEAANEINAAAVRFVAVRVGRSVARRLGKPVAELTRDDIVTAMELCCREMWPDRFLRVHHDESDDPGEFRLTVTRNYALHMVRLAGSLEHYRCPCDDVRAGWLEGLGLEVRENRTEGCLRDGNPACIQVSRLRPTAIQPSIEEITGP